MNAKMRTLAAAFEAAGFRDVRTVLGSGNVVFSAPAAEPASVERTAERAMARELGRTFVTFVRPVPELQALLAADPFARFELAPNAKRVVTFLRERPRAKLRFPVELHQARILCLRGREIFTAYVPGPSGPVFMSLIEQHFGKDLTTRTWDTVARVARCLRGRTRTNYLRDGSK